MVILDTTQKETIDNIEYYFIYVYLREFHSEITLNLYDTIKDQREVIQAPCVDFGKGITKVYIDYPFIVNKSYEIEFFKNDDLMYRGQIVTGTDVEIDNRSILKY